MQLNPIHPIFNEQKTNMVITDNFKEKRVNLVIECGGNNEYAIEKVEQIAYLGAVLKSKRGEGQKKNG